MSILVAIYGGALAFFSPIVGWAADRSSDRRLPLIVGLLALGASTVLLNLGSSIAVLCLGRVLQGISAAVVWVVGLALIADTVGPEEVAMMLGYVFIGLSLGFLLGPLLGGIVFAHAGYNAVFGMVYVLIGVDIGMRLLLVEKKVARRYLEDEDRPGAKTGGKTARNADDPETGAATYDEDHQRARAPESVQMTDTALMQSEDNDMTITQLPPSTMLQAAELAPTASPQPAQPRRRIRLPPVITLLASRRLLTALWATFVTAAIMTEFDSVLPLHVQHAFGWSSTGAGLIFLPIVIPSFAGPLFGALCDRYGARWIATAGFVGLTPAQALLRFVTTGSLGQKVLLCALLACVGLAMSAVSTVMMAEITYIVAAKEAQTPGLFGAKGAYAQAYGLFNLAFAVGCLVGPVWAGFVNQRAGWGTMAWSLAVLTGVSALPVFLWTGGAIWGKRRGRGAVVEMA